MSTSTQTLERIGAPSHDGRDVDAPPTANTDLDRADPGRADSDRADLAHAPLEHAIIDVVGAPFEVIWSPEDGAVRAAGFAEQAAGSGAGADDRGLMTRLARLDPELAARGSATAPGSGPVVDALRAYAAGDLHALDALAVAQPETPFRGEVWRALRRVEAGTAVTYTELAARAGRPSAVRAAASGCANNLVALIVPCHRIVRADGGLGGYLFGEELKERLLRHEGARSAR